MALDADAPAADGRRRRAQESRRRIVDAMMDLVAEGRRPSAEAVAERAEVGLRTVFRLFSDMDGLYGEMQGVMLGRLAPLFREALEGPTWRARLDALLARRARVFDEILPYKSAADAYRQRSSFLQREHDEFTAMQRRMLLLVLPEAVTGDEELMQALDAAFAFETWRRLRHDQKLTPPQALAVMRRLGAGLLADLP